MSHKLTIVSALALASVAGIAQADIIRDIGGGWQIVIAGAIQNQIDVVTDGFNAQTNTLVIEKFAEFTQIDPLTGMPYPLTITFQQIASDSQTASRIVITDEALFNSTGMNWTGFRMNLLPSAGAARFNPTATTASGFVISPFTSMVFSNGDTQVDFSGGVVASGSNWYPGLTTGGLVIDIDLSGQAPVIFSLKESPIPTPGTVALMGVGGLLVSRRRR